MIQEQKTLCKYQYAYDNGILLHSADGHQGSHKAHQAGLDQFGCPIVSWQEQCQWHDTSYMTLSGPHPHNKIYHSSQSIFWMKYFPDSKAHGANMGPIWGRHVSGGPHIGPMNFAIWVVIFAQLFLSVRNIYDYALTYWGLLTPYGGTDLGKHWLR